MSKEIERLKSKLEYCKTLINLYNTFNFITKSNKYDKSVEEYQNRITELSKRLQDLEGGNNERANNNILQ